MSTKRVLKYKNYKSIDNKLEKNIIESFKNQLPKVKRKNNV